MKPWLWVPICFVALLVPIAVLAGGESGFDGVVNSIESRYHVQATQIPFMGLASLIASRATDGGVEDVHVAEFKQFSEPVDGEELNRIAERNLGHHWERMIRETSRTGKNQTLIFSRPEGKRMGLFVIDLNGPELDVVQVSVNPDYLNQSIAQYARNPRTQEKSD